MAEGSLRELFNNHHLGQTMSEGLVCLQRKLREEKQRCRTDLRYFVLEVNAVGMLWYAFSLGKRIFPTTLCLSLQKCSDNTHSLFDVINLPTQEPPTMLTPNTSNSIHHNPSPPPSPHSSQLEHLVFPAPSPQSPFSLSDTTQPIKIRRQRRSHRYFRHAFSTHIILCSTMQLRCGRSSVFSDRVQFGGESSGEILRARYLIRGESADQDVGL